MVKRKRKLPRIYRMTLHGTTIVHPSWRAWKTPFMNIEEVDEMIEKLANEGISPHEIRIITDPKRVKMYKKKRKKKR